MSRYHFIGVGGAGLAPIARFLLEKGHQVSGSDLHESIMTEELKNLGVNISIGHHESNIENADVIIRSSAVPDTNIEVQSGKKAGKPVIKRMEFLGELTSGKEVIAVAGTHGKTTTTAMIAWCLKELGTDPSYIIGGISKNLGTNSHAGNGRYFVIEADEYDHMFLGLKPKILVVTNVEHDHPDHYPTEQQYIDAFRELTSRILPGGILIACNDNFGARDIYQLPYENRLRLSYGVDPTSDFVIEEIEHLPGCGVSFSLRFSTESDAEKIIHSHLLIPGSHNVLNASAALTVIHALGFPLEKASDALNNFSGTGRRFDIKGEAMGITVIDDYAHHPSEIRATLSAARCQYPKQSIWCVWQPHTYSRTKQFINQFTSAFIDCDHVIISEIFASREKQEDFSSRQIVPLIDHADVQYFGDLQSISAYLKKSLSKGDVLLVLSAGDADQISQDVLNHLQKKGLLDD